MTTAPSALAGWPAWAACSWPAAARRLRPSRGDEAGRSGEDDGGYGQHSIQELVVIACESIQVAAPQQLQLELLDLLLRAFVLEGTLQS